MTIEEIQDLVDAWNTKHGVRHVNELTNMAVLTEEVGELARVIARKHSDPAMTEADLKQAMGLEVADVMWVLASLANQSGINLTEALIDNLERRNRQESAGRKTTK